MDEYVAGLSESNFEHVVLRQRKLVLVDFLAEWYGLVPRPCSRRQAFS